MSASINKRGEVRILVLLTLVVSMLLINPENGYAHRMIIELVEDDRVLVRYDDGTSAVNAVVTVYGEEDHILAEGEVDEEGYFGFDADAPVERILADDGMGHRASWEKEEDHNPLLEVPIWIRALLGISILVFIASFFYYRVKT